MKKPKKRDLLTVGWREWVALPELGIPAIKTKVDTGARTSALHTFAIETFQENGKMKVRFGIHPLQRRKDVELFCIADVVDRRLVSDSGGHRGLRYVIQTSLTIGHMKWTIEMTLTQRDNMVFRMLLGRTAIRNRLIVDPGKSYLTGREFKRYYEAFRLRERKKK